MDHRLQTENLALRRQLDALLQEARLNEEKLRRFDLLERSLIATRSLHELVGLLLTDYRAAFGVDRVTLTLVDPEYEAARILESQGHLTLPLPGLELVASAAYLDDLCCGNHRPALGPFIPTRHGPLFHDADNDIASVAVLPLMRQGQPMGSLNLGSADPDRYGPDSGTDFLSRLIAIVAICLDSTLTHERLRLAGLTDPLTGVHNRRYFEHRCPAEISQAQRHDVPLACMFLDIDHFKRINDGYGHAAGDLVLRQVAAVINAQLRISDTVARFGGEEFVALLPQTAGHHALDIAERIRSAVAAQPFTLKSGATMRATVSVGLAMLAPDPADRDSRLQAEKLIAAADAALYRAKNGGRNRVVAEAGIRPASPLRERIRKHLRAGRIQLRATLRRLRRAPAFR